MSEIPDIQGTPPQPQSKGGRTATTILLAAIGCAVFVFCILPICMIIILALLGPAIGNVFSEIIDELITPTPTIGFIALKMLFT